MYQPFAQLLSLKEQLSTTGWKTVLKNMPSKLLRLMSQPAS